MPRFNDEIGDFIGQITSPKAVTKREEIYTEGIFYYIMIDIILFKIFKTSNNLKFAFRSFSII